MFSFLKNIFGGDRKRYESQKKRLDAAKPEELQKLAAAADTHPEILYYLAQSENAKVRKAVAENAVTPVQAASLLATDIDGDVRLALAARLVALLPSLSEDKHSRIYAYAVQALFMLAQDEVFSVRRALSSALRDYAKAPPVVVNRLARDVEREVSEPILRFCAALSDEDLLDILGHHPAAWVVSAIATREKVSARVADAVVAGEDVPATGALLGNTGADLSPEALEKIVARAREYPEWHKPIALRPEVTLDIARQLAGFVDRAVLRVLEKRSDFDAPMQSAIAAIVKRRMEYQRQSHPDETAAEKVARFAGKGKLSGDLILDAMTWQEMEFVTLALSDLSGVHSQIVKKMLALGAPKPVVALCWKAKVPMRVCIELQKHAAKIQPQDIMYARGGTTYPMTEKEIKWQLEFFGVKE